MGSVSQDPRFFIGSDVDAMGGPEELASLYRDLLIGVTGFFRDCDLFTRLGEQPLRELVDRLGPEEDLRIWCAACATGEEAYSLAILAHEAFRLAGQRPRVKVFATDVHRASLELAGAGVYPTESLEALPPDLRDRYFTPQGERFQVAPALRASIVFAHHNVLSDAPFTRIDIISCRNLLIYFEPVAQRKAVSLFLFGLRAGGVLVLGPSETPGSLGDEFLALDARWKIYRKRRDLRIAPDLRLGGLDGGREAEYQAKIAELTELATDMNHLLESTEVQLLLLDQELRIRRLTPKIAETFRLLPQDVGRSIEGFTHSLRHEGILGDLRAVLRGTPRVEREVQDARGRWFLMRALPYRPRQAMEGVVLKLVDITSLKVTPPAQGCTWTASQSASPQVLSTRCGVPAGRKT